MKVVYSRRAVAQRSEIATYYSTNASPAIAEAAKRRFDDVINRICRAPESAPRLSQRSQVRVVHVVRYPYRIFYQIRRDAVENFANPSHVKTAYCGALTCASRVARVSETRGLRARLPGYRFAHPGYGPTPRSSRHRSSSWHR